MFRNLNYLTIVVVLMLPLTADAQQRGRSHHQQQQHRSQTARAAALAQPKELSQILLPAGARRLPTSRVATPRDGRQRWQNDRWPRKDHRRDWGSPFGRQYAAPFFGGAYIVQGMAVDDSYAIAEPENVTTANANKGRLQLLITPATGLDYYIDGAYMGSSSNLGSEFEVNAGARQVEVRARGYKPSTFDTRIDEGGLTTVRGTLEAVAQPLPPASAGSRVMYVIPGCYIGNARPAADRLPAGCDVKKMVTRGAGL